MKEVGIIIRFLCTSPPPHRGKGWDEGHGVGGRIVFEGGEGSIIRTVGMYYSDTALFCRNLCYTMYQVVYVLYILCYVSIVS